MKVAKKKGPIRKIQLRISVRTKKMTFFLRYDIIIVD